jgi:predicted ATPase
LGRYDAVMLFLDRANSVNPEFTVTRENVSSVVKICVRLDGIPLAIELAAARVRALPVEEIAVRLDDRFRLLVGGTRTAVHRQQTLRALIDWSHDLLSEAERVLLRRLAVFAGGWTLGAAEEVCSNEEIEPGQVLDLLSLLIDKSLVIAESQGGHERYHFLETIRQYARERLDESGEKGAQECRHAEYFLKMAQESYGLLWGPKQGQWLAQLELEHENMRLALEWMVREPSRALMLLSMAGSLWRFWEIRGYFGEGRAWLDRALTANPNAPAGLRAHALRGMGRLARQLGDYTQARTMHEQSLALFREIEDKFGIAREMDALGEIAHQLGDYSQALAMHTESLAIRFEINDKEGMAMSLNQLGILALDRGQYQHAGDLLEESLKLTREMGDKLYTAFSLNNLGFAAYHLSEYTRAIPLIEEALSLYRELNDRIGVSNALLELGNLFKDQGYFRRAISLYDECLVIKEEYGDKRGVARVIVGMAEVAFSQGNYAHAADLSEKSSDLFRELGVKRGLNNALIVRAFVAQYQGQDELVHSLVSESLALSSEMDAPRGIAYSKALYGLADFSQGRLVEARGQFLEALAIFRKVGDRRSVARMLVNLARTAYRQADQVVATNYLEESMSISRELDCRWTLAYSLEIMGLIQRSLGHLDQAGQLIRESLRLSAEQDNQQGILNCLGALAGLAAMTGQPIRAARLFAVADRLRETIGVRMGVDDRREYERYLDSLRDQLTQATFEAAWSEGNALSVEAAIEEAERD